MKECENCGVQFHDYNGELDVCPDCTVKDWDKGEVTNRSQDLDIDF